MKLKVALVCLMLVATAVAQQEGAPRADGSIHGVVIASDGQPARRLGLTAKPLGVVLATVLPHTTTDDHGAYRFVNLPWWGRYTVYAEDEEAGYSSYSTGSFGQTQPSDIEVTPEHREVELSVYLPAKAAFLQVNLTNRKTGAVIKSMEVAATIRGTTSHFSLSCYSTKVVLLPSDKDILLHVTAPGFREWNESLGAGKPLRLASGTRLTLNLQLEPSD